MDSTTSAIRVQGPDFLPLRVAGEVLGWCPRIWAHAAASGSDCPWRPDPAREGVGQAFPGLGLCETLAGPAERTAALDAWARSLHARGLVGGWRGERVRVYDRLGQLVFAIERALLRPLGLPLRSVQAGVYTRRADGPWLWVAKRAHTKPVDPGLLDVLVAGGIAGDLDHEDSAWETLVRECAEEAGIPATLAQKAQPAGQLDTVCLDRLTPRPQLPKPVAVLHRETLLSYWLELPPDFVPRPVDGEHEAILALRPDEALASIAAGGWCREGAMLTARVAERSAGCG